MALGHEPRLITAHDAATSRAVEDGFEVVRLRRGRLRALRARRELRGTDAIVAAYPTEVPRRADAPVVLAAMGMAPAVPSDALRAAIARADAVTALSEAARDSLRAALGVEARIITPGIDLAAFAPGGERSPTPVVACAADPAEPRKRVGELRAAADALGVELRLAGPGDSVRALFREAWISGLASTEEAFGLVLVESLACGTPVFTRSDGGGREIVAPGTGVVFDDDLPGALRAALELAGDPATAARCRARAEAFPSRATAEAYAGLLTRLRSG